MSLQYMCLSRILKSDLLGDYKRLTPPPPPPPPPYKNDKLRCLICECNFWVVKIIMISTWNTSRGIQQLLIVEVNLQVSGIIVKSFHPRAVYMLQWTGSTLVQALGTNICEIRIKIRNFSFMEMQLLMSSSKLRPFCPGGRWVKTTLLP